MRLLGFEIIDYRHKSGSVYVIGDNHLEQRLKTYKTNGLNFRYMETRK